MSHPEVSEQVYRSAAQQRIVLLCDQGGGVEEARRYAQALESDPGNQRLWLLSTASWEFAGEPERALETALEGLIRFPDHVGLMVHAGDICRILRRYDEAFSWWDRALELDRTYLDAAYSKALCYEELGCWEEAYRIWTELVRELDRRGLVMEREFPARQAEIAMRNMNG